MDAVMYLKEKARMNNGCKSNEDCRNCPLSDYNDGKGFECCTQFENEFPEKVVEIVEKWSKEHPRKTYLSDFLEKFPNAQVSEKGQPYACAKHLGYVKRCICTAPNYPGCMECWSTSMEDDA